MYGPNDSSVGVVLPRSRTPKERRSDVRCRCLARSLPCNTQASLTLLAVLVPPVPACSESAFGRSPLLFFQKKLSWSERTQRFFRWGGLAAVEDFPFRWSDGALSLPLPVHCLAIRKLPLHSSPSSSFHSRLLRVCVRRSPPFFFKKTQALANNTLNVPFDNSTFLAVLVTSTCLTPLSLSILVLYQPRYFLF